MIVYQIKWDVGWVNNDLSMTINRKVDDSIKWRTFDQYFYKYMIIDSFRKVEYVQFQRRCLSKPKVRHDVDEVTDDGIRPHVLQEDHVVTAKTLLN